MDLSQIKIWLEFRANGNNFKQVVPMYLFDVSVCYFY